MSFVDTFADVGADTLVPTEIPTPRKLLRQADCYQQIGVKYPQRGTYHSYAEFLHFALCEGDADVTTFVPQPFRLRIGNRPYIPDAYLVRDGERIVVELKPRGEFDSAKHAALTAFFHHHRWQFSVISNESVLEREIEAMNWLHVVRTLCSASAMTSAAEERGLLQRFLTQDRWEFGALLDHDDRSRCFTQEVALYRLLHRGQLQAQWQHSRLGPETVLQQCA